MNINFIIAIFTFVGIIFFTVWLFEKLKFLYLMQLRIQVFEKERLKKSNFSNLFILKQKKLLFFLSVQSLYVKPYI